MSNRYHLGYCQINLSNQFDPESFFLFDHSVLYEKYFHFMQGINHDRKKHKRSVVFFCRGSLSSPREAVGVLPTLKVSSEEICIYWPKIEQAKILAQRYCSLRQAKQNVYKTSLRDLPIGSQVTLHWIYLCLGFFLVHLGRQQCFIVGQFTD